MLNFYDKLCFILFLLWMGLSAKNVAATSDEIATTDGNHYAIGRLEYAEHKVLYAQSTGVVEELFLLAAHQVDSNTTIAAINPVDPTLPRQLIGNNSDSPLYISKLFIKKGDFVNQYQPLAILVSPDSLQVNANVLSTAKTRLKLGQQVRVFINPDRDEISITGRVLAIHFQEGLIPLHKVEIALEKNPCKKHVDCANSLMAGAVVKVVI